MMTHYQIIKQDDICICIFENNFSSEELLALFDNPEIYNEELAHFRGEKRKKEFLGLRFALKKCLDDKEYKVIYSQDGKPRLVEKSIHISFSHTARWNVAITHPTQKIGVDIEIPAEKLKKVYHRFLNHREQEYFHKDTDLETLCLLWSSKETLYKIIGSEAVDFSKQLHIFPFDKKESGEISAQHLTNGKRYRLQYKITPSYVIVFGIDQ
ncbi:MAG: 4'-phosphopantetheinyl transferase family protein [Paludibacteraceae bacterium]